MSVFGSYMVPANIYQALSATSSKSTRLAFSHSGMIPWTAEFVADVVNESADVAIDANDVLAVSRANTRLVYGV
jgi:TatD DNase family protein